MVPLGSGQFSPETWTSPLSSIINSCNVFVFIELEIKLFYNLTESYVKITHEIVYKPR